MRNFKSWGVGKSIAKTKNVVNKTLVDILEKSSNPLKKFVLKWKGFLLITPPVSNYIKDTTLLETFMNSYTTSLISN